MQDTLRSKASGCQPYGLQDLTATINIEMLPLCLTVSVVLPKGLLCTTEVDALGGQEMAKYWQYTSRWRCSTQERTCYLRALHLQADKNFTLRRCTRRFNQENLTLRQTMIDEILVERWQGCRYCAAAHQRVCCQRLLSWQRGTALRGNYHRRPKEVLIRSNHSLASIDLMTISRNWASKSVVSRQEPLHIQKLHLSTMMWQRFSQETRHKSLLALPEMRTM